MATKPNVRDDGKILIFRPYFTKNGKKIYPKKGKKCFPMWVDPETVHSSNDEGGSSDE